jgi:hypothetical protein
MFDVSTNQFPCRRHVENQLAHVVRSFPWIHRTVVNKRCFLFTRSEVQGGSLLPMVVQTGTKLFEDHLLKSPLGFVKLPHNVCADMILAKKDPMGGTQVLEDYLSGGTRAPFDPTCSV